MWVSSWWTPIPRQAVRGPIVTTQTQNLENNIVVSCLLGQLAHLFWARNMGIWHPVKNSWQHLILTLKATTQTNYLPHTSKGPTIHTLAPPPQHTLTDSPSQSLNHYFTLHRDRSWTSWPLGSVTMVFTPWFNLVLHRTPTVVVSRE